MWQYVKIPSQTPASKSKIYEVLEETKEQGEASKNQDITVESLYPKITKQIKLLKKTIKKLEDEISSKEKEISDLSAQAQTFDQEKQGLQNQINAFKTKEEQLRSKITQLAKSGGGQGDGSQQGVEHTIGLDEPKVYAEIEEKVLDEHGQPGALYH